MPIGFLLTTAESAAGVTPTNFAYEPGDIRRYGAAGTNTSAANLTALNTAITVAKNSLGAASLGGALITIPAECHYGYKVTDLTTYPQFSGTVPIIVYDYSQGSSYAGFPTQEDGAQVRIFMYTPTTTNGFTFTTGPLSGATSATLASGWSGATGQWLVAFSNGDVRQVDLMQGLTSATWSPGLSSNATINATRVDHFDDGDGQRIISQWAPYLWIDNGSGVCSLVFTTSLLSGATSGTLTVPWPYRSGAYSVTFPNAGADVRSVTLAQGATTATWSPGLGSNMTSPRATYLSVGGLDNRRASIFFGADGTGYWQVGQGTLSGAGHTFQEMLNFAVTAFPPDGRSPYVPMLIEMKTGNIGFGVGANNPSASYYFKSMTAGYAQAYYESLSTTSSIFLRTSNGATDDGGLVNRAGQMCINISTQGDAISFDKANRRATFGASMQLIRSTVPYSTSMTPDATIGNVFTISANDGVPFSIAIPNGTPSADMRITIVIRNINLGSPGNLGAVTWASGYKLAPWAQPAKNFSRTIDFRYDGTNWIEASRTPADVPI